MSPGQVIRSNDKMSVSKCLQKMASALCAGRNSPLQRALPEWQCIARSDLSVIIQGESGCGKEVLARSMHRFSPRAPYPFVAVNCGALPDNLLESELFGVRKGAFTGAVRDLSGKIRAAGGGTLFLDEIAELSLNAQKKLLRVLQEKQVCPVGAVEEEAVDFRLITATHRNISAMVEKGLFREDLFYRMAMYQAYLPPLRDRWMDLERLVLALGFADQYGEAQMVAEPFVRRRPNVPDSGQRDLKSILRQWHWPGNIRELRNVLERARAFSDIGKDVLQVAEEHVNCCLSTFAGESDLGIGGRMELPDERYGAQAGVSGERASYYGVAPQIPLSLKQKNIIQALEQFKGNQSHAANALGISRGSLQYQIRKLFPARIKRRFPGQYDEHHERIYGRGRHSPGSSHPV